jgi:hypothetical protein
MLSSEHGMALLAWNHLADVFQAPCSLPYHLQFFVSVLATGCRASYLIYPNPHKLLATLTAVDRIFFQSFPHCLRGLFTLPVMVAILGAVFLWAFCSATSSAQWNLLLAR